MLEVPLVLEVSPLYHFPNKLLRWVLIIKHQIRNICIHKSRTKQFLVMLRKRMVRVHQKTLLLIAPARKLPSNANFPLRVLLKFHGKRWHSFHETSREHEKIIKKRIALRYNSRQIRDVVAFRPIHVFMIHN